MNKKLIPAIAAVFFVIFLVAGTMVSIPIGSIGIEVRMNQATGKIYQEGTHFFAKPPLFTSIIKMNTRIQDMDTIETQAELSKQELVYITVQTKFKMDPAKAIDIYREAGVKYIDYLAPRNEIIDVIKSCIAKHTVTEMSASRDVISAEILDRLNAKYNEKGIIFTSFSISNYNFDSALEAAINEMNIASQTQRTQAVTIQNEKERAQADKELAKINAEKAAEVQKVNAEAEAAVVKMKAEAEAEAIRIKAQAEAEANAAIAASITPELNAYKEIERWNGSKATIVTGETGTYIGVNAPAETE